MTDTEKSPSAGAKPRTHAKMGDWRHGGCGGRIKPNGICAECGVCVIRERFGSESNVGNEDGEA